MKKVKSSQLSQLFSTAHPFDQTQQYFQKQLLIWSSRLNAGRGNGSIGYHKSMLGDQWAVQYAVSNSNQRIDATWIKSSSSRPNSVRNSKRYLTCALLSQLIARIKEELSSPPLTPSSFIHALHNTFMHKKKHSHRTALSWIFFAERWE